MFDLSAPLVVYALALFPALLWGVGPIVDKRALSRGGTAIQAAIVVLAIDVVLFALVLAVLGVLGNTVPLLDLPLPVVGLFVLGGLLGTAIGRLATFVGVDKVGASVNTAVINTRPLFASVFAITLLGEVATLLTIAGVVVLVVGLVTLTLGKGGDLRGWEPRHLAYPLLAAATFGIGNVVRRYGLTVTDTTVLEALFINELTALVVLLGYALVRRREALFGAPAATYALFSVSGVITAFALGSLFAALAHPEGRVVIVDPLAGLAPLFTTVFSYFLLRDLERVTKPIVGGTLLVVLGVTMVTLS